jgi:hypothetical protein
VTGHYLKWTRTGRTPSYQRGTPIPYRRWTPPVTNPIICERGWHACRWQDAIHHISDELWICELDGIIVAGSDKVAAERLRLVRKVKPIDDRSLRLFAADCAEQVLPIFERVRPDDDRPRAAIDAARRFARGEITRGVRAAARDAARDAAGDAAGDAAWAAAMAAAGAAAGDAAGAAARAAAGDAAMAAAMAAAMDAAWAAAMDAARDAAGDAAGAAARAAAGDAAMAAAMDAAWAAAMDAAMAAAMAAARKWETSRLLEHYADLDSADFAQAAR